MQMLQYTLINGKLLPSEEAHLSPQDRGFRFGDGLFETLRVEDFTPYQWHEHMQRLQTGASALRIALDVRGLKPLARMLIQKNHLQQGFLRISISRGVGSEGYRPVGIVSHTVLMETMPARAVEQLPCKLHLSNYQRPCANTVPAGSKLAYGITNTLALLEAADHGCEDAVILSPSQHVAETSSANLFWVKNAVVFTPPLSSACVAGTTRAAILRLWKDTIHEHAITPKELLNADEICISNVRYGVRACVISGQKTPDYFPVTQQLAALLEDDKMRDSMLHRDYWQKS